METKSNLKIKIKEQEEIIELIKRKLKNVEILKQEFGNTPQLETMTDFYLDQFLEVAKYLEKLKSELEILKMEYQLFPEKWKIKKRYYEKRNKKRNR